MKNKILNIIKIALSAITFPLWFIKMYVNIGHLPNQTTGEIVKILFRHSMYENVCAVAHPFLAYIVMAVAAVSIVLSGINLKLNNQKMQKTGDIVSGVAIGLFIIFLIYASTIARGY